MANTPEVHHQPYSTLETLHDNPDVSPPVSSPQFHDEKFPAINPQANQLYSTLETLQWQPHNGAASYTAPQQPAQEPFFAHENNFRYQNQTEKGAGGSTVNEQPEKESWKRRRICGIPLLVLFIGLVVLVLVIGAVVGGVVASRSKSSTPEEATSPNSTPTATSTSSIESSSTTSTSPVATSSSAAPTIQDTWITGDNTKTWVFRGQYDYFLFFRNNNVQMYEVDIAGFTPQDYRWSIISVQDRVQESYANNSIWNGGEPRPLYYIRNIAKLDDETSLAINDTIAAKFDEGRVPSGDTDIPLTMEKIQGKASLSTRLWYFRPLNSSTDLNGAEIPWSMHNVYKGDEWAVGAADDGGRYNPGLQPTALVGKQQNTWYLQEPIGREI